MNDKDVVMGPVVEEHVEVGRVEVDTAGVAEVAGTPVEEPEERLPEFPGQNSFYSGSDGPWLQALRDKLGYTAPVDDRHPHAGFRETDRQAVIKHRKDNGATDDVGQLTAVEWNDLFAKKKTGNKKDGK
jgi:hypothetical protein